MKNAKKVLLTVGSFVLTAALAIGGTVAYLHSEDSDVNVMTLGNVKIEQIEQERDENGNLVEFTQAKPAFPAVGKIAWDATGVKVNGTEYKVFDSELKNVVDKIVTVNNIGKSDAYVRTVVAIEAPEGDRDNLIHFNYNNTGIVVESGFVTKIDGVDYYIVSFVYTDALTAGAKSAPSLMQLFLDSKATNDDCAKFGESWQVLVVSQAVQTAGFDNAQVALDTAFGKITKDAHPWKDTVLVDTDNQEELKKALTDGKEVVLNTDIVVIDDATFDGNGSTVTLAGSGANDYGYLAFVPETGKDTKVENITATGSGFVEVGHWGMGGGNYEVNKLVVKDMASTLANNDKGFTLACAFCHYGNATLNDCVMTGTTAVQEGAMPVDLGCVNGTTTIINRGEYGTIYCWSHAVVTIDDAKIDTLQVAPIKGTVTIKAGTNIETINVAYGTSAPSKARLSKLVIEDGATVGEIVFDGNTYTVAGWNTYVASLS